MIMTEKEKTKTMKFYSRIQHRTILGKISEIIVI